MKPAIETVSRRYTCEDCHCSWLAPGRRICPTCKSKSVTLATVDDLQVRLAVPRKLQRTWEMD